MCEELGINPNGKATNAIKEALKENALAGITAKIEFTGWDGIERTFEFTTTRYTVIFTGEKLPNGAPRRFHLHRAASALSRDAAAFKDEAPRL
jgi:hypothetical protein